MLSFVVAMVVSALLTPVAAKVARRVGAVDQPRERGLAFRDTPLLGGLAILAGVLVATAIFLPDVIKLPHTAHGPKGAGGTVYTWGVLVGACVITAVGALDDAFDLKPQWKLVGQIAAAVIAVEAGAVVTDVTLRSWGRCSSPTPAG